jgi:hypothetical protein
MMNSTQPIQTPPKDTQQRLLHQRQIERNIENERLRKLTVRLEAKIRQQQEEEFRLVRAS